jgi:hypothetical protein
MAVARELPQTPMVHHTGTDVVVTYQDEEDITGCTFRFRIYDEDENVVVEKTSGSGITVLDPNNYELDLSDDSSHDLPAGRYRHEMRITDPPPRRTPTCRGPWVVKEL